MRLPLLIDPHFDPADRSPEELAKIFEDASVDGAALTPLHRPPSPELVHTLQADEDKEFIIFAGVKLETEKGTLLFFPEQLEDFFGSDWTPPQGRWAFSEILERCARWPGVLVATHPYDHNERQGIGDRVYTCDILAAVETRIGRGLPVRDHMADRAAEACGLARLGASGGSENLAGRAMTVFPESVEQQRDFVAALREGLCWPIEVEDPRFPRRRFQLEDDSPEQEYRPRRRPAPRPTRGGGRGQRR